MAASANSAKTLQIAVETEKLKLESQLATRNSELDAAVEKLKAAEENLAMVINEKDKQISEVNSLKDANAYIKKQADELNKKLKEAEQEKRKAWKEIDELKSPSRFEEVVQEYKGTQRFKDEVFEEAFEYFNRGVLHAFRNLHQFVPNKKLLVKVFEGVYTDPELRGGCDFVPYTEKELADIAARDQREGRSWSQPAPIHPNFEELCDFSEDEWEEVHLVATDDEVVATKVISASPEVSRVERPEALSIIPEVPELDEAETATDLPSAAAVEDTKESVPASALDPLSTIVTELATPVEVTEKNGEEESAREDTSVGVDPVQAEVEP